MLSPGTESGVAVDRRIRAESIPGCIVFRLEYNGPVRYSEGHRGKVRERILDVAARTLRERSIDGVGLRDIMKRAGLATKGGFYAHFRSREHLVVEAMERALQRSRALASSAFADAGPRVWLEQILRVYLSRGHRDALAAGCPLAAVGPELARSSGDVRKTLDRELQAYIDLFAERLGDRRAAIGALATMVGGLQLARATDESALSDEILEATRAFIADGAFSEEARA